jgi:hypothetical protein
MKETPASENTNWRGYLGNTTRIRGKLDFGVSN